MMIFFVSKRYHYLRKISPIYFIKKQFMVDSKKDSSKKEAKVKEEKVLTTKVFLY